MPKSDIKIYTKDFLENNQTMLAYASTPKHKHEFWEFVYWVRGKSKNIFEGVVFDTVPGLVLFIRPSDVHENNTTSVTYSHRDIYIKEEELKEICDVVKEGLFEELAAPKNPLSFSVGISDIDYLESLIKKTSGTGDCTMDTHIRKVVVAMLLGLYLTSKKSENKTLERPFMVEQMMHSIDEVVRKMRNGELQNKVELLDLAVALNYDYGYVSRQFKKYMGVNPKMYLYHKKMTIATVLLSNGMNIATVTEVLQYTAISHFVKSFKKYYGVTPSTWRKSHATQQQS